METMMISSDRFTRSAQEVPQRAAEIMQRYSHNQMDSEHLFLEILSEHNTPSARILEAAGLTHCNHF
jgi:ATP-dependent Clp protease ATP-binding subunit ClpC